MHQKETVTESFSTKNIKIGWENKEKANTQQAGRRTEKDKVYEVASGLCELLEMNYQGSHNQYGVVFDCQWFAQFLFASTKCL